MSLLNVFIKYDRQPVALRDTAPAPTPAGEADRHEPALPPARPSAGRLPRGRVLRALEAVKTEQATDSAGHVLQIS